MNEYLFENRDPRSLERIAQGADCDVLLFGHTHIPWQREIAGVRMINTGSVGKPKDGDPRACWVQLDLVPGRIGEVVVHRIAYDVTAMAAAIRAADGLPDHFANDIETGGRSL
jgi:predicted phosphodiesterase